MKGLKDPHAEEIKPSDETRRVLKVFDAAGSAFEDARRPRRAGGRNYSSGS